MIHNLIVAVCPCSQATLGFVSSNLFVLGSCMPPSGGAWLVAVIGTD